jgi:chromosome segregation ATPase
VSSLPVDPAAALARVADELAALRSSIDGLERRVGDLTSDNASLRARLEHSETARRDLAAQADHLVELLAEARRELRALQSRSSAG